MCPKLERLVQCWADTSEDSRFTCLLAMSTTVLKLQHIKKIWTGARNNNFCICTFMFVCLCAIIMTVLNINWLKTKGEIILISYLYLGLLTCKNCPLGNFISLKKLIFFSFCLLSFQCAECLNHIEVISNKRIW